MAKKKNLIVKSIVGALMILLFSFSCGKKSNQGIAQIKVVECHYISPYTNFHFDYDDTERDLRKIKPLIISAPETLAKIESKIKELERIESYSLITSYVFVADIKCTNGKSRTISADKESMKDGNYYVKMDKELASLLIGPIEAMYNPYK